MMVPYFKSCLMHAQAEHITQTFTDNAELLGCLSKDLLKLFESSTIDDVSITVGEAPNIKTFKAHSAILVSRSPYFATALSSNWVKKENNLTIFQKPNITPQIFETLIK